MMKFYALLGLTGLCVNAAPERFLRSENELAVEINKGHQNRHIRSRRQDEKEDHLGFMVNFNNMTVGQEDFHSDFGEFIVKNYRDDGLSFVYLQIPESLSEDVILDVRTKSYIQSVEHELTYQPKALYWNKGRVGSNLNAENYV
eukprot:Awhi_evm1s11919